MYFKPWKKIFFTTFLFPGVLVTMLICIPNPFLFAFHFQFPFEICSPSISIAVSVCLLSVFAFMFISIRDALFLFTALIHFDSKDGQFFLRSTTMTLCMGCRYWARRMCFSANLAALMWLRSGQWHICGSCWETHLEKVFIRVTDSWPEPFLVLFASSLQPSMWVWVVPANLDHEKRLVATH